LRNKESIFKSPDTITGKIGVAKQKMNSAESKTQLTEFVND
jgi:hypothetical protein